MKNNPNNKQLDSLVEALEEGEYREQKISDFKDWLHSGDK